MTEPAPPMPSPSTNGGGGDRESSTGSGLFEGLTMGGSQEFSNHEDGDHHGVEKGAAEMTPVTATTRQEQQTPESSLPLNSNDNNSNESAASVTATPVTEKVLELLEPNSSPLDQVQEEEKEDEEESAVIVEPPSPAASDVADEKSNKDDVKETRAAPPAESPSSYSMFGSWWGGSSSSTTEATTSTTTAAAAATQLLDPDAPPTAVQVQQTQPPAASYSMRDEAYQAKKEQRQAAIQQQRTTEQLDAETERLERQDRWEQQKKLEQARAAAKIRAAETQGGSGSAVVELATSAIEEPPEPEEEETGGEVDTLQAEIEAALADDDNQDENLGKKVESINEEEEEEAAAETPTDNTQAAATTAPSEEEVTISRKSMDVKDQKALDDAFEATSSPTATQAAKTAAKSSQPTSPSRNKAVPPKAAASGRPPVGGPVPERPQLPKVRGLGHVHPETPIPNADVCLRLLRKFAHKTRPHVTTNYGGTKPLGLFGYMFGGKEDPTFIPYKILMGILDERGEVTEEMQDESEVENIVVGIMGESGDSMDTARRAMAAFCFCFSSWGHASAHMYAKKDSKTREAFGDLLAAVFNAASTLVAHGCLDNVVMIVGDDTVGGASSAGESIPISNLFTQAVLTADLNPERNELAAMKFLLSAGCRTVAGTGEAMLGGSHLLQTIRMLYHIFLTTESRSNKVTARAALQQLVTNVFTRMAICDKELLLLSMSQRKDRQTEDAFPSDHHRNAFLVLRAICKLSMRALPDGAPSSSGAGGSGAAKMHSHIGYQTSGSSETWDGMQQHDDAGITASPSNAALDYDNALSGNREHAQLIYTAAIHPALESKILALDLIHYVLTNTQFPPGFILRSGPQFHAAIRNYLCVSLLKNCTSAETHVVNLSLRIFVPLVRNFRTILKNEIEAFVTNVFFVILDSKNSSADHKGIVVKTFDEICSDPATLAEIFLNYDCDLSAVDLFHRIVNTLSRVSRTGLHDTSDAASAYSFMGGQSAARMEKIRFETRELRLDAMKALRQVLASLHASIVEPMSSSEHQEEKEGDDVAYPDVQGAPSESSTFEDDPSSPSKGSSSNPVEVYNSKTRRRAEESEAILRFNQKPSAGISYAAKCGHIDGEDAADVARYLLALKDVLDKTMIGEYLGREAEYQNGFSIKVLHEYVRLMDFAGLVFDDAIRFFLSGFRLPGEAQKIDRIMEKFAERFTEQNPSVFPTADVAFILSFSIIMLNTDLHNPAIKEERRMTREGFIRNNRGICDGQDLPSDLLNSIFDRIKENPISLKEDDDARERAGEGKKGSTLNTALSPASFFVSHYDEMDRARESNFRKERDHIVRTTETLLKRRRHSHADSKQAPSSKQRSSKMHKHASQRFVRTEDSGLRDEYVAPMFEASWGPALAAFSTAMESANGTMGLLAIATDEELEIAAENAAETIEVCLTGFRFAICTGGLCGNDIARDSFMLALSRFTQLGSGALLEPRHVRCIQTMLSLAREDGELIGSAWQHVFRALSEVNRFHQIFHLMARNDRAAAAAADRRRRRLEERETRKAERRKRKAAVEESDAIPDSEEMAESEVSDVDSFADSDLFSEDEDFDFDEDDMDAKAIDEANARLVYEGVSEDAIEAIYERSSSLSAPAIKEFVDQLCYVSSMEIRGGGSKDLNKVAYRQQHALVSSSHGGDQFHHSQPNIYNLQKLVEVAHYNMDSRPRLIFADLWSSIAEHLTQTSLHKNPALAMYAVDSFRQLSIQYLQRDELEVFEFQRRFLKPLETVMAKSNQSSTKELLLNCVARVIQVFEGPKVKGGLRSGWVPLLAILGLGGQDRNVKIARMSCEILSSQIDQCMKPQGECSSVLLTEHFPEAVDAVMKLLACSADDVAMKGLETSALLASYLADENMETPQVKKRSTATSDDVDAETQRLELWWPILMGISRATGDDRPKFRAKALETLLSVVNDFFFPEASDSEKDDTVQRLQLVFRGVLTPMLEFAEIGSSSRRPRLPKDFDRFITKEPSDGDSGATDDISNGWLDSMFDPFMDACVALCKRAVESYKTNVIIEEVFAMLNHCLVSDSGALAVRGIARLEQFVTSDLDQELVREDAWATVCHMLRKVLSVRGLPRRLSSNASESEEKTAEEVEYEMEVREFIAEESALSERRYAGASTVEVIGSLLTSDRISQEIGFRWSFFLISGLGRGIYAWEEAAYLLQDQAQPKYAPHYLETAFYGRKLMNRFLLQLAANEEVAVALAEDDPKTNRYRAAQKFVIDETQHLLKTFVRTEKNVAQGNASPIQEELHKRFTKLAKELVKGLVNLRHEHVLKMTWLNPILLSSCLESKNEDVLEGIRKFVEMTETEPKTDPKPAEMDVSESENPELDAGLDKFEKMLESQPEGALKSDDATESEEPAPAETVAPSNDPPAQESNSRSLSADI